MMHIRSGTELHLACVVLLLGAWLGGCGDSERRSGGGGGGSVRQIYEDYCRVGGPALDERCGYPAEDFESCMDDYACVIANVREDAAQRSTQCLAARECGGSDDDCYDAATLGLSTSATVAQHRTDCFSRDGVCGEEGVSLESELCEVTIFRDAVIAEMADCLSLPCSEIVECQLAALGPYCG